MGATALLVIGGIAGATVGRAAWDRVFPATPAVVPASPVSPAIPSQPVVSPVTAAPTAIETAPATAPSAIPAPAAAARPVSVEEQRARKRTMAVAAPMPATEPAVAPSAPVEVESSELTRLLERARFELTSAKGDPARARVLAEDYLSKAPKGMSVEDAMYLACLAAARNGDADATQLARRYLERFPAGNFAAVVRPMAAATESTR